MHFLDKRSRKRAGVINDTNETNCGWVRVWAVDKAETTPLKNMNTDASSTPGIVPFWSECHLILNHKQSSSRAAWDVYT